MTEPKDYSNGYEPLPTHDLCDANRIGFRNGYSAALRAVEEALLAEAKHGGEFENCCYQIAKRLNLLKILTVDGKQLRLTDEN